MTLASTTAAEFSIANLVLLAYRKSALVGPYQDATVEQYGWAVKELQTLVDRLATRGLFAKTVTFSTIELDTGVWQYTMDADAIDILGAGMYIAPGQTLTAADGETPVIPMTRDEWQMLSSKSATGTPTRYYLHRDATPPVAYLWPVPSAGEEAGHIRFEKHRLRASNLDASKTMDFERYWSRYFIYALAHELSLGSGLPMDRVQYLAATAEMQLKECTAYSKQRAAQQFIIRHGSH